MYVIINLDSGKYVTPPGSKHSYTGNLEHARTFTTPEEAHRNCCGNERVSDLATCVTNLTYNGRD